MSPDGNPSPIVQCLPESNDTGIFQANPLRGSPETHDTNDHGYNLNAHGSSSEGTMGRFWRIVCERWRDVFPKKLEHGFYIAMGGFELMSALSPRRNLPNEYMGRVTPWGVVNLRQINLLPELDLALINDQSKSDLLTKVLVCLQTSWMIIQCIARVAQTLPLTLLEVHTVGNAIYAFFIYCLWLKKPHDVRVTTKVKVDDEMLERLKDHFQSLLDEGRDVLPRLELTKSGIGFWAVGLSTSGLSKSKNKRRWELVIACLGSAIYAGVHLTVQKGHFPSNLERILWKASAFPIVGLPFMYFAIFFWAKLHEKERIGVRGWGWLIFYWLKEILLVCWVLARAYLVVESFASLRSLPVGSYDTVSWVSLIPHF